MNQSHLARAVCKHDLFGLAIGVLFQAPDVTAVLHFAISGIIEERRAALGAAFGAIAHKGADYLMVPFRTVDEAKSALDRAYALWPAHHGKDGTEVDLWAKTDESWSLQETDLFDTLGTQAGRRSFR